jgi:nitrate/nitrite transporter NarK
MMVATPVLAGALLRIVMGILVDRLSPKKAAIIGQVIVIAAMAYAWLVGVHSYAEVLILGLFLGVAGASFAAALPLASRWYPPSIRARRWALPAPATPAPRSLRCSPRVWRRLSAGSMFSVSC